jgi:hypothetical protein
MKRFLTLALTAALVAALTATAFAGHQRARTWKATLKPVTADPAQTTPKGKAQAVVNKNKGKISIHVKGLTPGTTYAWHIHTWPAGQTADFNPCAVDALQGGILEATYKPLTANADGNASAKGTKFTLDPAQQYYVNVHAAPGIGAPIACGVLTTKATKAPKPKPKQAAPKTTSHTHA